MNYSPYPFKFSLVLQTKENDLLTYFAYAYIVSYTVQMCYVRIFQHVIHLRIFPFKALGSEDEKAVKSMLLPLAERMVTKYIKEGKIEAEAGNI